jgi:hypothetical protein
LARTTRSLRALDPLEAHGPQKQSANGVVARFVWSGYETAVVLAVAICVTPALNSLLAHMERSDDQATSRGSPAAAEIFVTREKSFSREVDTHPLATVSDT